MRAVNPEAPPGNSFARRVAARQLSPTSGLFLSLCAVGSIGVLYAFSWPGSDVMALVGSLPLLGGLSAFWLVLGLRALGSRSRPPLPPLTWMRFAIAPLGASLVFGLCLTDTPLRLRFETNRTQLEAARREVIARGDWDANALSSRTIGSFNAGAGYSVGENVIFWLSPRSLLSSGEMFIAHLPDRPEQALRRAGAANAISFGDGWYAWGND